MTAQRAALALCGLLCSPCPASAQVQLDGTEGPLVLYGTETRIIRAGDVPLIGAFEISALAEFTQQAKAAGYFGVLVVDRSEAEVAYTMVGLHGIDAALAIATALCRTKAPDPANCAEAARAVPAGLMLADTGGATLSRAAVPLFIDLLDKADPAQGRVAVAIADMGYIAVSGPQPTKEAAGEAATAACRGFVDKGLAEADAEQKAALVATGADRCRVVFVR